MQIERCTGALKLLDRQSGNESELFIDRLISETESLAVLVSTAALVLCCAA